MSPLTKFKCFLWLFSRFKVPMIGYTNPKIIQLTDKEIVIRIRLNRRTKNHLHSMYFGALAVGADIAGGLHGFYHAQQSKVKLSLAFKSFQAEFLKRPESDVYFVCSEGDLVKAMIEESNRTKTRINKPIQIIAYTQYPSQKEEVARFSLELSMKVI